MFAILSVPLCVCLLAVGGAFAQAQRGDLYGTVVDTDDGVATQEDCREARRSGARDADEICAEADAYENWLATEGEDANGDGVVDGADFLTWQRGQSSAN